jgi:hypothetical protein
LVFQSIHIYFEIALQPRWRYENLSMFSLVLACSATQTCALSISITFMPKRSRQAMPIKSLSKIYGTVWLAGIPGGEKAWTDATTPIRQAEGCTVLSGHG